MEPENGARMKSEIKPGMGTAVDINETEDMRLNKILTRNGKKKIINKITGYLKEEHLC